MTIYTYGQNPSIYVPYGLIGGSQNGFIGIGASLPQRLLDVRGDFALTGNIYLCSNFQSDFNLNSAKLRFNAASLNSNEVQGPSIQGINVGPYAQKRLAIFQHFAADYSTESEVLSILPNGDIGFGNVNPETPLHIKTSGKEAVLTLQRPDAGFGTAIGGVKFTQGVNGCYSGIMSYAIEGANTEDLRFYTSWGSPAERMRISATGDIFMNGKLNLSPSNVSFTNENRAGIFCTTTPGQGNNTEGLSFYGSWGNSTNVSMVISGNGNVGIGVAPSEAKLDVEGTIRAHEVKVCLTQGCDFVFKKDYKLRSIDELDKFIQVNNHLPDIAPAKEMESDGINLSEMNAKLLQKIEEQTLYIIDMNKQLQELKKQMAEMKKY